MIQRTSLLRVSVWASILGVCFAQRAEQLLAPNLCTSKTTCSECIRVAGCGWCSADDFNGPRCFERTKDGGDGRCDEAYTFFPKNSVHVDPAYDMDLSRAKGRISSSSSSSMGSSSGSGGAMAGSGAAGGADAAGGSLVQMKPQKVKMQLRQNRVEKFSFKYSRAQDYPVDLYYLMDLSRSMKNDKDKLSSLGNLLSATMRNMTSNFKIGFGSFVDKVVMPYVSVVPRNLESPCEGCAAPYGYKNQMSLSSDTDYFDTAVAKADVSGNLDAPEGGFDAIMQAVVCKREIGWRDQARRLLVFSTDAGFHYAGDGKLGGIVQPNDGQCHMENNVYTYSTLQDYPSIAHINLMVKKHAINLIFAVTAEQIDVYEQLSKHIEGSSSGVLSSDSDNVVDLVREQYNKITSAVEMKDSSSDAVEIKYYSSCLGNERIQTNKCGGLKVGDVVTFDAEITLKECPKDRSKWTQVFDISPVGVSDRLTVELEMLCDCPCERPGNTGYIADGLVCSGQGVSACGVCLCGAGHFGKNCECSATGGGPAEQDLGCRPANATAAPLCSGRGSCVCGACECDVMDDPAKVITGAFCECDNFGCDMNKGQLCSGADHGECLCGKCSCKPEYKGDACQCLLDKAPCRSPENGEVCSGNGECVCGQCICNNEDGRHYSGKYCEKCPTCPGRCGEFKDCVLCEVHKRGPLYNADTDSCPSCALLPIIEEGKIEANESRNEHLCSYYDDLDCLYVFVYFYDEAQHLVIRAQKEIECPNKVPIFGIVLGVIAAIVLVGLALLMLWKMATTIHDRREFARFEKERAMAKWDTGENPIYKQATSTFKNPTYAGK